MDALTLGLIGSVGVLSLTTIGSYFFGRQGLMVLRPRYDELLEQSKLQQEDVVKLQQSLTESKQEEARLSEKTRLSSLQIESLIQKLDLSEQSVKRLQIESVEFKSQAQSTQNILDSERQILAEAKEKLNDAFKSSASEALEGNNKQFLELAQQFFIRQTESAKGDLDQRQQSIESMVNPFKETMEKYQVQLRALELERQKSYTNVESELKRVMETSVSLSQETRALKDALKKPHIRGRWGEIQLKNCVELAGMSEYADVTFQDVSEVEEGQRLIPDLTVKMPGGRLVIVDCKAPLDAFMAALEAKTEEERAVETARHGRQVKDHIKKLSSKEYQTHLVGSADFTVMFLPNESFLYAALESEGDLVEYALQKKILVATPPTFVGLLKVIRYGWNEEKLARNASEISVAGNELHKRLVDFVDAFEGIGKHLDKAKTEYEKGFYRLNSKVLVQARKMETLGIKGKKELSDGLGYLPKTIEEPKNEISE